MFSSNNFGTPVGSHIYIVINNVSEKSQNVQGAVQIIIHLAGTSRCEGAARLLPAASGEKITDAGQITRRNPK